jgi:hypothetical protein
MCPISPMQMIVSDISSLLSTYFPNISGLNHWKKTGKCVVKALQNILTKDRKCKKLRSDGGKEFNNNTMKQENIYYFTTLNSDTKANVAERGIKT